LPYNRICFTFARVSKKSGTTSREKQVSWNAVIRNRARRLGREAFRLMKDRLDVGFDLIFLVYPEADRTTVLSGRTEQLESLFKKAGLLK